MRLRYNASCDFFTKITFKNESVYQTTINKISLYKLIKFKLECGKPLSHLMSNVGSSSRKPQLLTNDLRMVYQYVYVFHCSYDLNDDDK